MSGKYSVSEGISLETLPSKEAPHEGKPVKRAKWGSQREFILSCIGYTVGLGNVWRFPYLAYQNGGAAFVIPYIIMLLTCGIPMYILEVGLGQYMGEGPMQVWRAACPLTQGIGYAMLAVSSLTGLYYNVIIGWVIFYLFASFQKDVPWRNCDPKWSTHNCHVGARPKVRGNGSLYNETSGLFTCQNGLVPSFDTSLSGNLSRAEPFNCTLKNEHLVFPSVEYYNNYVLHASPSIDETGVVRWQLVLCLLLAWILVYFAMWKGVKVTGKVMYFTATFPYVVLIILLIRGVTLPNALAGIKYYITPDFKKILNPNVWAAAGGQLFYSLGPAYGTLLSYGSYNNFNNNCVSDAMFIAVLDTVTSTIAGLVIFSVLGFMAGMLQEDISKVVAGGPGLAFMVYPEGIAQMPISTLWAILFFFMLFTLGVGSQIGMMECVITNLCDEHPKYLRKYKELTMLAVCVVGFFFGFTMLTESGIYWFTMFDSQSAGVCLLFVAFIESFTVGWLFGCERLAALLEHMTGRRPALWWLLCWKFFTPAILFTVMVFKIIGWTGLSYGSYHFPPWAEFIGWMISFTTSLMIPIFAGIALYKAKGDTFMEKLRNSIQPNDEKLRAIGKENGFQYTTKSTRRAGNRFMKFLTSR